MSKSFNGVKVSNVEGRKIPKGFVSQGDIDWIVARGQWRVERLVGVALTADRVHRLATAHIDNRNDIHRVSGLAAFTYFMVYHGPNANRLGQWHYQLD